MDTASFESLLAEGLPPERPLTVEDLIERELDAGVTLGPFHRQWLLERAPWQVRRNLASAAQRRAVYAARQGFASMDVRDFPPVSFTAIASTVTETNLWVAADWTPIAADEVKAGKVYKVSFGGIISNTGTPTVIFTPRYGQSATPASNVTLGASPTVTTVTGLANHSFYGEFTLGFRQIAVAASGATGTGNGFVTFGNASANSTTAIMGGTVATTLDNIADQGLIVSLTWGTSSASNTCTCQWVVLRSYN